FWGARNERGPITRFEVEGAQGATSRHILVQGGPDSEVWTSDGPGAGRPDRYWLDAELVGVERIRGRQACIYLMTPPADFSAANPSVRAVRAYLDAQY